MFCVYQDQKAMTLLQHTWEIADESLRNAIGQAIQRIGRALQNDPQEQGESRPNGTRILFEAPVAVLFEIEEWSYEEIGKVLELRNGTVKSRISRARQMLRKSLAPWWAGGQRNERNTASRLDAGPAAHEGIARIQV